jgi:hypothetical protein
MFTIQGQGCWCNLQVARAQVAGEGCKGQGHNTSGMQSGMAQVADAACKWQLGAGC